MFKVSASITHATRLEEENFGAEAGIGESAATRQRDKSFNATGTPPAAALTERESVGKAPTRLPRRGGEPGRQRARTNETNSAPFAILSAASGRTSESRQPKRTNAYANDTLQLQ